MQNCSDSDEEETSSKNMSRDEFLAKFEVALLGLIFLVTFAGNALVLICIYLKKKKMTRMYFYTFHLALADFITAFFTVLSHLIWKVNHRFQGGNVLCKIVKYIQILGPYASSYILMMTALDMHQSICYPLRNLTWKRERSELMLTISWAISFLFCIPQVIIFSYREVDNASHVYDCWANFHSPVFLKAYVTWYSVTVFIIPLVFLVHAYFNIVGIVHKRYMVRLNSEQYLAEKRRQSKNPEQSVSVIENLRGSESNTLDIPTLILPIDLKNKAEELSIAKCRSLEDLHLMSEEKNSPGLNKSTSETHLETTNCISGENDFQQATLNVIDLLKERKNITFGKELASNSLSPPSAEKVEKAEDSACNGAAAATRRKQSVFILGRHSLNDYCRANVKTIKMTAVIIFCYVCCSLPFIVAQLWMVYYPDATKTAFFSGPTFTFLTLLPSLNSCVNPFICLYFNPDLLKRDRRRTSSSL